ncbi:MAG TPA: AAA family ATPase, partial [Bacteroidales bacterium]|nr:AAA family ATPase [Bacteroidales bacterium]
EVQYLDDPSNFLKLLYDEYAAKIKIIATGSNAFYMNDHFRDSLAGRKKLFLLYTCAFDEYLEMSGKQELHEELGRIQTKADYKSTRIELLLIEWEKFIIYGGYPAVITESDTEAKIDRLKELRDSFVKRDILESGVQNENAFYKLFHLLASQTGNLVNINELASTIQIKNETVANYLTILQKCFHISLVKPHYNNVRKELIRMQKVYLLDTGMRNSLLNNFRPLALRADHGELWENIVYRLLIGKYGIDEVYYWRTSAGNEIDFVLPRISQPKAIEAKYDKNQVNINKYKLFSSAYPGIPLGFSWMSPGDEDFFRRIS